MCYHQYTSHQCGHSSRSIGKCKVDILATEVPFCDRYHFVKDQSLELCGGNYCKEDKETAHWIENGQNLLTASNDDLAILKNRLVPLYEQLQTLENYRQAFGALQPIDLERARIMHEEYVGLRETFAQTTNKRQLILDGMKKAREKQQAVHAEKMHRVQEYVDGQTLRSVQPASPQSMARVNQTSAKGPIKRTNSGIWETGDTYDTPCRPVIKLVSPVKLLQKQSVLSVSNVYSPRTPASPLSYTNHKTTVDSNTSPPKKRRGRPPKTKVDEVTSQPRIISQTNNNDSLMADDQHLASKRRTTKRSDKKRLSGQGLTSPAVRRSGRAKQRVSYAESPSSSPERPDTDQLSPGTQSPVVGQRKTSTRLSRITSSKKASQQDDMYATDEEDRDKDVNDDDDDDEWQVDGGAGEDIMDIVPTPVHKARSNAKRTATSPAMNAPVSKRQAMQVHRTTINQDSSNYDGEESPDVRGQRGVIGNGLGYMQITTTQSVNSGGAYFMPTTPSNNMANGAPSRQSYYTNPMANGVVLDPKDFQAQNVNVLDMSPLRRSDWLNGLNRADMALSLNDIDDPNSYDFDVNAMSKVVADFDAQQA
ncbi:hypothetical protein E4T44_10941 [Aureobasidium sp. EXF-8845]|nr:hypothetical protein E4T45_10832 [Aureobasidium sp. EXF-8846]KAI4810466.1 hypothetical protein E4T44_10941 [Aureobasidium sp. EXF-8845]